MRLDCFHESLFTQFVVDGNNLLDVTHRLALNLPYLIIYSANSTEV